MTTDPITLQGHQKREGGGDSPLYLYELVVGASDPLFPLAWIPMQTARAVHQQSAPGSSPEGAEDESSHVVALTRLCHGEDGDWNESLEASHWEDLNRVWSYLPPLRLPVSEVAFEPYQRALTAALQPLDWEMEPMFSTLGSALQTLEWQTEDSHREALKRRVLDGTLIALDGDTRVPLIGSEWRANAVLTLEGLRAFAAPMLINVVVRQASNATGAASAAMGTGVEQRKRLLKAFKRLGGAMDKDGNQSGQRGALSALVRADGRDRKSVTEQLRKAFEEESPALSPAASAFASMFPLVR